MNSDDTKVIPVIVAVRCRPLVSKECNEGARVAVKFNDESTQIILPDISKSFTFDHVFCPDTPQEEVYTKCGVKLIDNLFKGYNATVLAYGQTGSGKTFTMGTAYNINVPNDEKGVIPRSVSDIFKIVNSKNSDSIFSIRVSFLEVYKESIFDLFSSSNEKEVTIREDFSGIKIVGIKELPVDTEGAVLCLLEKGSQNRRTGRTNMNEQSSRSHAIFTITLEQRNKNDSDDCRTSKFHLVDLAGSERAKKTGAKGSQFKEGVSINKGLLALGNVISALCDGKQHVPYRDSKLTRLLQDSLGGNSYTVMVACVGPADSNLEETANTLRYADRARKIKNKPVVNKDPRLLQIEQLNKKIFTLEFRWRRHVEKCPIKGEPALDNDTEELENDLNNSNAYDSLIVPGRNESDEDANGASPRSKVSTKLLRNQLAKTEQEKKILKNDINNTLLQVAGLCRRVNDDESIIDQLKTQLKVLVEEIQMLPNEQQSNCGSDCIKTLQDKLQPHLSTSVNLMSLKTPVRKPPIMGCDGDAELNEDYESSKAISKELQTVDEMLSTKQNLFTALSNNKEQLATVTEEDIAKVEFLEAEIKKLNMEKDCEISSIIVPSKNPAMKMSEERRKKIKKLEDEIAKLQKELSEKTRLLEIKKEQERRMNCLEKEIRDLKSTRVTLMRKMENEAKRLTELQRKMKTQNAKHQNENIKANLLLTKKKEENAQLLRKFKAAQSANQKLAASLAKQNSMARERAQSKGRMNTTEKIRVFLSHEIEVEVNRFEAKKHVEVLFENRARINEEIAELKDQLSEISRSPIKKRISGEASNLVEESSSAITMQKLEIEQEISRLKQCADETTCSIQEIQRNAVAKPDHLALNELSRWNGLEKIDACKCALSYLFDMVLQLSSKNQDLLRETEDTILNHDQMKLELELAHEKLKDVELKHEQTIKELTDKHNAETLFLLEKLSHHEQEDHRPQSKTTCEQLVQKLKLKSEEVEHLQTELEMAKIGENEPLHSRNSERNDYMDDYVVDANEANFVVESDEASFNKSDEDPDWHKTPLKRNRRTTLKVQKKTSKENVDDYMGNSTKYNKPQKCKGSNSCKCKGSCGKRCGCRKAGVCCSQSCSCSDYCMNYEYTSNSTDPDKSIDIFEATFLNDDSQEILKDLNRRRSPRNTTIIKVPTLNITRTKDSSFFLPPQ